MRKEGNNTVPYKALGDLFIAWREERFRSALMLSQEAKFSFGYNRYNSFEKGSHLPSLEQIVEIASFLGQDPLDAAILWAQIQMPTEYLRKHFQPRRFHSKETRKTSNITSPSLENTWLMSPADLDLLKKYPWLSDLTLCLSNAYPKEACFPDLNLHGLKPKDFIKKYIQLWVDSGYVKVSKTGMRLERAHVVIPDTPAGQEVISNNMRRASEYVTKYLTKAEIEAGKGFRFLNTRNLSAGQLRRWIRELERVSQSFLNETYEAQTKDSENFNDAHVMLLGLAPRDPRRSR